MTVNRIIPSDIRLFLFVWYFASLSNQLSLNGFADLDLIKCGKTISENKAALRILKAANKPKSFNAFELIKYKLRKAAAVVTLLITIGVAISL